MEYRIWEQTRTITIIIIIISQILNVYHCFEHHFFSCRVWIWQVRLIKPPDIIPQATVVRAENPLGFISCVVTFSLLPDVHLSFNLVRKKQWGNSLGFWVPTWVLSRYNSEGGMKMPFHIHILFAEEFDCKEKQFWQIRLPKQAVGFFFNCQGNVKQHFLNNLRHDRGFFLGFFFSLATKETLWTGFCSHAGGYRD